jgi:hypothetical protein
LLAVHDRRWAEQGAEQEDHRDASQGLNPLVRFTSVERRSLGTVQAVRRLQLSVAVADLALAYTSCARTVHQSGLATPRLDELTSQYVLAIRS